MGRSWSVFMSVSVWLCWPACGSGLNSRLSPDKSVEPVEESIGVDVCMIGLFVVVLFGKGWVSGIQIVLLNLLLDPCLVTGGEVRWLLAGNFASLALAWLSISRRFVLDFG